jgi:lysozyme family protein
MKDNRIIWLDLIKRVEGGWSDDPRDRGGCTNLGVTLPTLSAWRRRECTPEDLRKLTWDEACALYSARFWGAAQGDKLPPGVDVAVADMAVNSGVRQAAKTLQRVLAVKPDGHVGPATLEAARRRLPGDLVKAYGEARLAYLQRLPGWTTFGKGWSNRVAAVQATALRLAREQAFDAPESTQVTKIKISSQVALAAGGAVVAAIPAAREAYLQATSATASLGELAAWMPASIGFLVAVLTLAMLARRSLLLADQQ